MGSSRNSTRLPRVLAVAGLALVLGLSACSSDPQLPTINGSTTGGAALEQVAKAYFDCMTAAGLPVELDKNNQGQMAVVNFQPNHDVLARGKSGFPTIQVADPDTPLTDPRNDPKYQDFFNGTGPTLVVDGMDHTDEYVKCLDESGYDEQAAYGSFKMPPEMAAKQVDANNKWAACAREHGWPDIQDSTMPVKNDGTDYPEIKLPITITEDQLRQLIKDCPTFDPDTAKQVDEWYKNNPSPTGPPIDLPVGPSVGIDTSSIDVVMQDPNQTPSAEQMAEIQRIQGLYDIINQAQNDYYNSQNPSGGPA